jgi:thioredoxin reductase (NADPH)
VGEKIGGQFTNAVVIENYPGFLSTSGEELSQAFKKHAESYGVSILQKKITTIKKEESSFAARSGGGELFRTRSLLLLMGRKPRLLGVSGEDRFSGKGVTYCATCDAPLFKGKRVAVVGGGNSALSAAAHTAAFAKKVYLIHRRQNYRGEPIWVERVRMLSNVEEVLSRQIKEIKGGRAVEEILLDKPWKGKQSLAVEGVFVEIGSDPVSALARSLGVELDEEGSVKINPDHSTNVAGVFAAGDVAQLPGAVPLKQIVNTAGGAAEAATAVYNYICQLKVCEREEQS